MAEKGLEPPRCEQQNVLNGLCRISGQNRISNFSLLYNILYEIFHETKEKNETSSYKKKSLPIIPSFPLGGKLEYENHILISFLRLGLLFPVQLDCISVKDRFGFIITINY